MDDETTDLLIIGAGPTGLFAAYSPLLMPSVKPRAVSVVTCTPPVPQP